MGSPTGAAPAATLDAVHASDAMHSGAGLHSAASSAPPPPRPWLRPGHPVTERLAGIAAARDKGVLSEAEARAMASGVRSEAERAFVGL